MKIFFYTSIFWLLISTDALAQVGFEPGYIINSKGEKIACLIENKDWLYNPTNFNYKLTDSPSIETGEFESIKEFGVGQELKFVRALVKIDRSSSDFDDLSRSRNPEFKEEKLFLKVLVEGEATLYSYSDKTSIQFFFKKKGDPIEQLVHKFYYVKEREAGENNLFRQQLLVSLNCSGVSSDEVGRIRYAKKDLQKYFIAYNKCTNGEYTVIRKPKKNMTHLSIKGSVIMSWTNLQNSFFPITNIQYEPGYGFGINLELEHVMSFNKNKWSFLLEPGYQTFRAANQETNVEPGLKYNAFTLPIGLRYSMFTATNSRLMLSALWGLEFTTNSSISDAEGTSRPLKNTSQLALGLGFKHKRFLIETRYRPRHDILTQYMMIGALKSDLLFSFGYTFF